MNPEQLGQSSVLYAYLFGLESGVDRIVHPNRSNLRDLAGIQEIPMKTGVKMKGKEQEDNDVQNLEREMDEMTDPELLRNARRDQECNLSIRNPDNDGKG